MTNASLLPLVGAVSALTVKSRVWQTLFVLIFIAVGYLALSPAPPPGLDLGWDKLNHVSAFAALAFTGFLSGCASRGPRMALLAGLLVYGGAIEIGQFFVPGRACEWGDLGADSIGIAGGAVIAIFILWVAPPKSVQ